MNKCKECRAELVEGAKFCIICGVTVTEEPDQAPIQEKQQITEKAVQENLCPSCGAALRTGASFCVDCGNKVFEGAEDVPSTAGEGVADEDAIKVQRDVITDIAVSETDLTLQDSFLKERLSEKEALPDSKEAFGQDTLEEEEKIFEQICNFELFRGEEMHKKADELGLLAYGKGVVSKITFSEKPQCNKLVINGKIKCHDCKKLFIFTIESNRGWGGSNDPVTCPCNRTVEYGDYWDASDDSVYLWASTDIEFSGANDYPLSILIGKVLTDQKYEPGF
jgi:uncharacterized Zn finger protein (UPF0148 family)